MAKVTVGTIPETDYSVYDYLLDYPHLYKSINDDFSTPGLTLSDTLTCQVTWQRNQFPTLQMTYPRDGIHMLEIQESRYLMTDINYKFVHQIFKITHVTQELDDVVVEAEHIAATLNDATVPNGVQFANATAQDLMNEVLNDMIPAKDFNFDSTVTKLSNVNVAKGQQAGAILIDPDQEGDQPINSVVGLYGGELEFDNFDIHHSEHAGTDTGITINYGKNMSSFSHDVNSDQMWTGAVFTVTYTPGQAIATEKNVDWSNWTSDYSNVGIYAAGGSVQIFDSPVEGHQVIGTLVNGVKLHLGKAVKDGDYTSDGKFQINTVNKDDWYPIAPEDGGGWIDGRWISFDVTGTYMVNDVTGDLTVQAQDPNDSSGQGSRVSMSGTAVVAYKKGSSIHVYYSPEVGPDHYRTGVTYKNGEVIHYDMIERNSYGDEWYRIGDHAWLYGPHLSLTQEGAYQSYKNSGYGYIKSGAVKYHWNKKKRKMEVTTKTINAHSNSKQAYRWVGKGKHKHKVANKSYWKEHRKKTKVKVHKGRATIDHTIVQGGKTYEHTKYGWVSSGSIDYKKNGSYKPKSTDEILKQHIQDHSKVEIYATPDKNNALNWSIPTGTHFTIQNGHEAKGGDGKTYIQVTYAGKTGWIPEDSIDDSHSHLNSPDATDSDDDSSNPSSNIDGNHNEVTVTVGPLYADGFGIDPNIDKVNTVDVSSEFKHDDQDLSGQQADGTFVATQADMDQLTQIGKNYIIEHRYGHLDVQDTIGYQEMSGINADWTQVSLYDYVHAYFEKYRLNEKEEINETVWDCLAHHYISITIGKLPITWQHLLLQQAADQTSSAMGESTRRTQGWLNRFENMMHSEGSDRRAKENGMMEELGDIQKNITYKDAKGKIHTLKDVFLESRQDFENHFQQIDNDASDIKSWIDEPGDGVIQAIPNWQSPSQFKAKATNNATMTFDANGLEFFDNDSKKLLGGIDSRGKLYADSIEGVQVKAMEIDALMMHGNLKSEDPKKNMKIYVGTENPGSTLNPWKDGRVIWVVSDNYSSMVSSGQIATTSGSKTTRIHPSAITVGDDDNQVLTQENFAAHAYRRIKSWVELWIADWITVNKVRHYIWKGKDSGNMGKLRDLPGQGKNNYTYVPGSNDNYGEDDGVAEDGTDIGEFITDDELAQMAQNGQLTIPSGGITIPDTPGGHDNGDGTYTVDPNFTDSKDGMLTYTQEKHLGLPRYGTIGSTQMGNDGNIYIFLVYSPTGNGHWYLQSKIATSN